MKGKKLKRSYADKKFLGVCGGIGEYLGIDSNAVRVIWAVASVCSFGAGVIGYILAAIIMPEG